MKEAITHLCSADRVIAPIITKVGEYSITYREPEFSSLARSIVFQQLSGKSARPIFERLNAACGGAITPEAILSLRAAQLRKVGLSRQKSAYLRDLATRTAKGEINFSLLPAMSDEEVITALTRVKGIGEWTVHMFLIFALRRPNVLPVGDYGVRSAIKRIYRKRKLPTPRQVEQLARKNGWHPYCSVAAWYLWRSLDNGVP
jgi:DNA-3-methyladenine glycosylase II